MTKNIGMAERIGRAGVGVILALIGISTTGAAMWILLAVGAVLIVTAGIGFCPIHKTIGISTIGNVIERGKKTWGV